VDLTWVPQLNTDLALFLKRQGKARLAANGHALGKSRNAAMALEERR
jgi:hypothetical protein